MYTMFHISSAHELNSEISWPRFPRVSQEVLQWKPKSRGKKQKSQIDDGRTEISYSASTAVDGDFETSTYISKDLATTSSQSCDTKRGKKRSKKSLKDTSGSVHSEPASISAENPEPPKEIPASSKYFVTLDCPLCDDPDCVLNQAAKCPLLRHGEASTEDCCTFCGTHCNCNDRKSRFLLVSGLVARDENGVAATLLKSHGGPIENSYEWANRKRWDVPSNVRWEHKISEWTTSPTQENMKAQKVGHHKKSHKMKNKRKSRPTASAATSTAVPEVSSNSEEPRVEEDDQDGNMKLVLEGQGFKIFSKGNEKILINYERKNCKYIGCKCLPAVESVNCGCGTDVGADKSGVKHKKNCPSKKNISVLRETSHGMEPIKKELEEKLAEEKAKSSKPLEENTASEKMTETSSQKLMKSLEDKQSPQTKSGKHEKKMNLSAKDLRNMSRAGLLESSLRSMFGDDYKKECQATAARQNENDQNSQQKDDGPYISIPCPAYYPSGGNLVSCTCAHVNPCGSGYVGNTCGQ